MFFLFRTGFAESPKNKVIYKYKQYERFDLGNLEVKGNILAPGDLSVKDRDRRLMQRSLLKRLNFDKEIKQDIFDLK